MLLQVTAGSESIIIGIIAGSILFLLFSVFIVASVILYQRRRHQHTLEITDMKNKYEAALLQSQLEIQEQTLRTISQEIHDNIGQVLTLAKIQLHSLGESSSSLELQPTKDLIAKSINDLRDLSKSLNPDRIANIGLVDSIRHELELLGKTKLMKTAFEVNGEIPVLTPGKSIIIFRIFQELMNNSIRHSQASLLTVTLDFAGDEMRMILADNGRGFDGKINKGIGLRSMHNRAAMIGAALDITSAPGNGTAASLAVTIHPEKEKTK